MTSDELHQQIMNLPCVIPGGEPDGDLEAAWTNGYKRGHKDARHAAAELVAASLSPAQGGAEPADHEPLITFEDGQWWVLELDAMAARATDDQKRAVAVVHHLLRAVAATHPSAPQQEQAQGWIPPDCTPEDWRMYAVMVYTACRELPGLQGIPSTVLDAMKNALLSPLPASTNPNLEVK